MLWFLPLIFILWANLHIQFIYGLAVLALLLVEAVLVAGFGRYGFRAAGTRLSPNLLISVAAASVLATLVSPYHICRQADWGSRSEPARCRILANGIPRVSVHSELDILSFTLAAVFASAGSENVPFRVSC